MIRTVYHRAQSHEAPRQFPFLDTRFSIIGFVNYVNAQTHACRCQGNCFAHVFQVMFNYIHRVHVFNLLTPHPVCLMKRVNYLEAATAIFPDRILSEQKYQRCSGECIERGSVFVLRHAALSRASSRGRPRPRPSVRHFRLFHSSFTYFYNPRFSSDRTEEDNSFPPVPQCFIE